MRVIFIPESPEVWLVLGIVLLLLIAFCIYRQIRPPLLQRLLADQRYRQALAIYAGNLPGESPPPEDLEKAFALACDCLIRDLGVPAAEAGPNLRLVVKDYDRARSYDLRHEALAYEEAGAHDLAVEFFERAARLQERHDPEDHAFLMRCVARVRGKVRPRKDG